MATDDLGIPRYWAHAWVALDGKTPSDSTRKKMLAAADRVYDAFKRRLGEDCLDCLLAKHDLETITSVMQGLFLELRNSGLDADIDSTRTWRYASKFVRRILHLVCLSKQDLPGTNELLSILRKIESEFRRIDPHPGKKSVKLRALPSTVVEEIYEIIGPDSPNNPFRTEGNAFRNFVIVILLLHLGLRRGESGILTLDAIHREIDRRTGAERYWMNIVEVPDNEYESRWDSPSLKTAYSVRQIPIPCEIAAIVERYISGYRGNHPHPFIFVSQLGSPLSLNMFNDILRRISDKLSPEAREVLQRRRSKQHVTPHDARHTAAVVRLTDLVDAGMSVSEATDCLKVFFGWSRKSEMPLHYARAYYEERLHVIWNRDWDVHVDRLRSLESKRAAADAN